MAGARLQGSVVQLLVFLDPADEGDSDVGDGDAPHGAAEQQHGEEEPVDVVDGHVLARKLEQRRVVTISVLYQRPTTRQPHRQTHQDGHQHQGHPPRGRRQPDHGPGGHDGVVPERVAYGHVSVNGHDDEDHVRGRAERVAVEGLNHALVVGDEALGGDDVSHQPRQQHGVAYQVIDGQVTEEDVHGLVQALLADDERQNADVGEKQGEVNKQQEEEHGVRELGGNVEALDSQDVARGCRVSFHSV